VRLYYGDSAVATGRVRFTTLITFGVAGFSIGHHRGSSISPAYRPPFAFTPGAVHRVVIEADGRLWHDSAAGLDVQVAMR
jgi:hypothetical protein